MEEGELGVCELWVDTVYLFVPLFDSGMVLHEKQLESKFPKLLMRLNFNVEKDDATNLDNGCYSLNSCFSIN